MIGALALLALTALAVAAVRGRRARQRLARAEHEIRGALCALQLGLEAEGALGLESASIQLARAAGGLDELRGAAAGRLRPASSALDQIAGETVAGWRAAAAARGRRIELDWHGEAVRVGAERARLAQITCNLVANALEHGSGTIRVSGRADGGRALLTVRDEGPRAPGRSPRRHGLGLGIAAAAARASGGSLQLSRGGAGTSATVELPARTE